MTDYTKSFADLVKEAPLYTKANTVTLTGALARSPEEGKFVIILADGTDVTLDTNAVTEHTVLGGSFGQQLVQLTVEGDRLPQGVAAKVQPLSLTNTNPYTDYYTSPYRDHSLQYVSGKLPDIDTPFTLATGHHISPRTLAEMEARPYVTPLRRPNTDPDSDYIKRPAEDGTRPVYVGGHFIWSNDY